MSPGTQAHKLHQEHGYRVFKSNVHGLHTAPERFAKHHMSCTFLYSTTCAALLVSTLTERPWLRQCIGSKAYMAPELLTGRRYNEKVLNPNLTGLAPVWLRAPGAGDNHRLCDCFPWDQVDIFSLGVTLYELLHSCIMVVVVSASEHTILEDVQSYAQRQVSRSSACASRTFIL